MSTQTAAGAKRDPNTEMSSQRTALSLERTLMSADRTQMSVVRTSLSLISFGFTIHKFFEEVEKSTGHAVALNHPARNFGASLVILGMALLVAGLFSRYLTMRRIGRRRQRLYEDGLLDSPPSLTTSPNMVVSILLLFGGLLVLLGMIARIGPFD